MRAEIAWLRWLPECADAISAVQAAAVDAKAAIDNASTYEAAKAALPTDPEGTPGHTVTITKGDKTLKLVNPDKVSYDRQD